MHGAERMQCFWNIPLVTERREQPERFAKSVTRLGQIGALGVTFSKLHETGRNERLIAGLFRLVVNRNRVCKRSFRFAKVQSIVRTKSFAQNGWVCYMGRRLWGDDHKKGLLEA